MKAILPLLTICLCVSGHAATLTHLWTFDAPDAFNDKVGSAHGTAGGLITTVAGRNGGTAMFAPSTVASAAAYVDIADANISSMTNTGFSVSYWFKVADDNAALNRGFFDFSGNNGDTGIQGLFRGATDNALNFRIDGSGAPFAVIAYVPTISVEDNAWHHIALTFQGGLADGFKLYLDGSEVSSASTTSFTAATGVGPNVNSYLGSFNFTGSSEAKGLNGALDDFAIWSGVLTPAEVGALAIPEPSAAILSALGLLAVLRRRR